MIKNINNCYMGTYIYHNMNIGVVVNNMCYSVSRKLL